jgi:hypothetical protein
MSRRHHLAEQQTRDQELAAMCLVAAVTGAVDAQHTGKGSVNDVFDFRLECSDGHAARGEVVAFARQGEHPGNAEVPGIVGPIGYNPANWDPDADLREMLTRPAIQKHFAKIARQRQHVDETHLVIVGVGPIASADGPAFDRIDNLGPLVSTVEHSALAGTSSLWIVGRWAQNLLLRLHEGQWTLNRLTPKQQARVSELAALSQER